MTRAAGQPSTTTTGTDAGAGAAPAPHRASAGRFASGVPLHTGIDVRQALVPRVLAAVFPLTFGVCLFGFRAAIAIGLVLFSAWVGTKVWRQIGRRGPQLSAGQVLWAALLTSLAVPAHLASLVPPDGAGAPWAALVAAGLLVPLLLWLGNGLPPRHVHPVAAIVLLLMLLLPQALTTPRFVLQRQHMVLGDLFDVADDSEVSAISGPWATAPPMGDADAVWRRSPAGQLSAFTRGERDPRRPWISLDELVRDRLPPLEDLIIGGQPGPIGTASAVGLIMGGLFLLYRGLIDFRVPLLTVLSAYVALLLLPVPVVLTDAGPQWCWLASAQPGVGWSSGVTLANYELLAGPLLLIAFFLAPAPGVSPMTRRGRAVFAVVLGGTAAALQLYASVAWGPYLALVIAGLCVPVLDRVFRPRPLV